MDFRLSSSVFIGTIAALLTSPLVNAADITIDVTIDLQQAESRGYVIFQYYPQPESISVSTGDNVDMTVRFAHRQRLAISATEGSQQFLCGWLYPDFERSTPGYSNFTIINASLEFLEPKGFDIGTLEKAVQTDGNGHLGPLWIGSYIPPGQEITFSGYRTRFQVSDLQESPYLYVGPFLQFAALNGGNVTIITSPPPEVLLDQLLERVIGLGAGKSLQNKIALAQTYLAASDTASVCATIADFRDQVRALRSRKLDDATANELDAGAVEIMTVIGCTGV